MIILDRREAGRFRAAVRRCVAIRPRSLAPPIALQRNPDSLTLSARLEEVAISLCLVECAGPPTRLVIPFTTLAAIEGNSGEVTLEETEPGRVHCQWVERGGPRGLDAEAIPDTAQALEVPSSPTLHPVDPTFLHALHACGQTASREATPRFALTRLQIRGREGQVAGTDGRQLLLWGDFTLPFADHVLVPAVPVFGGRELAGEQTVRIGRTPQHVTVAAGPWTIWLTIDTTSRYPDVASVIPRSSRLDRLVIDDADAVALTKELQTGPTSKDEVIPVLLNIGERPAVRWPDGTPGRRGPFNLIRSTGSGAGLTVTLNPQFLARALALGFREVCSASAEAPVLFRDAHRSYLLAPFAPAAAPPATEQPMLPAPSLTRPLPPTGEEPINPEGNGNPSTDQPLVDEALDPLAEAEALRTALAEVARRVGRLISALRQFQKQRRALQTAWTSLKHLRLGPQEEP